ncbi:MAG: hypothetical protein JO007_04540 [Alphaproteobacteria bacterium]|nr:hypothetical protein [Alphaproteobacteria bacterium]
MREMPCTRQMPCARAVTHVLPDELGTRSGIEHICFTAVELVLEDLPINNTHGTLTGGGPETGS